MKTKIKKTLLVGVLSIQATALWAASPWLPEPGRLSVTTLYVYDSFQDYRQGKFENRLPEPYKQFTGFTFLEYGLRNNLAIDVDTGYTATDFRGNGLKGLSDTSIGMRWQAVQGERWVLTLRGAAIIKGSYPISTTANFSPGDKASGGLGSAILGVYLPRGLYTFAETGYRIRSSPVPQDFFGNAGLGHSFRRLSYSTSYQTSRSINGVDIVGGAPKFSPYFQASQFPATKKIFGAMDFNTNVRLKGGVSLGFNYSKILHGRNVGLKDVFAVSFGFVLPGQGPHLH
jgi:hypothetical protein